MTTLPNCGSIKLIMGCMYSGKTSELIREWERWNGIDVDVLVINFSGDDIYGDDDFMYSHTKNKAQCVKVMELKDVSENTIIKYNTILINEGQFFPDLKEYVLKWCEEFGKDIVVAGLDGDFKRKKFGDLVELIPLADDIQKMKALCSVCKDGTEAIFSLRLTKEQEQTVIGASNYIPVCRNHYKKLSSEKSA